MERSAAQQIRPVLIGIGLTMLLLAGLAYLANQRRSAGPRHIPSLRILHPAAPGTVDSPLVIKFTSSDPLRLLPTGWGSGDLHLHATINGVSYMPAASEISEAVSTYSWTITSLNRGPAVINLGWADMRHRELQTGTSDTVRAVIR